MMRVDGLSFSAIVAVSLLLLVLPSAGGEVFCVESSTSKPAPPPDNMRCNASIFQGGITVPPPVNNATFEANSCQVMVVLDLGQEITSMQNYGNVQYLIDLVTANCMSRGIGTTVVIYPLFNQTTRTTCCSTSVCQHEIGFMGYSDYVASWADQPTRLARTRRRDVGSHESSSVPLVVSDAEPHNFTTSFLKAMKYYDSAPCLYNSMVFITNRMYEAGTNSLLDQNIEEVMNFACVTPSVILTGRPEATYQDMERYFGRFTSNLFLVPDLNCLPTLASCLPPCGSPALPECDFHNQTQCNQQVPTTTVRTTTTMNATLENELMGAWHIVYLVALSTRTTSSEFTRALTYVGLPIEECKGRRLAVRFLAPKQVDTGWIVDTSNIVQLLNNTLAYNDTILDAGHTVDVNETETMNLFWRALSLDYSENESVEGPRLTLLTDFVSKNFVDEYDSGPLLRDLSRFDFDVVVFDEEAAQYFHNHTIIKPQHVLDDDGFATNKTVPLCIPEHTPKHPIPAIVFILIGSFVLLLLAFGALVLLYRQRYLWINKVVRLRDDESGNDGSAAGMDEEMAEGWEISWDRLMITTEKIGSGAYGEVFRGKLVGTSPGIMHFLRHERATFTDCEVAIKMLPRHASDMSKTEFLREIETMRLLIHNDHVVKLVGCITSGPRPALILELCPYGDLAAYVRRKKQELEMNRSIDEQVEVVKELLQFSWQIADAMNFIGDLKLVHRDLAARNILIDVHRNAKVADFGLCISAEVAANLSEEAAHAVGRLPIKWLAPECMKLRHFSVKSDVWSYGIVLWEMHTLGETPFEDIKPVDLLSQLEAGVRPKRPLLATDKIWEMMTRCWEDDWAARPGFDYHAHVFAVLLEQSTEGYGYLPIVKSTADYHYHLTDVVIDANGKEKGGKRGSTAPRGSVAADKDAAPATGLGAMGAGIQALLGFSKNRVNFRKKSAHPNQLRKGSNASRPGAPSSGAN